MVLRFIIPAQDTSLAHLTEMRVKQLQAWLSNLQTSNPQLAAQTILTALAALNRQPLSGDIRLTLLTHYWLTAEVQIDMLQLQLSGSMLPLTEKTDAHARLARELLIELAYGYKLALIDNAKLTLRAQSDVATVVYQLLTIQQRILTLCYEIYAPVPVGIWTEIHQAFEYAELTSSPDRITNILHLYQQTLLIALADPYHLMQGELSLVIDITRALAPLCTISHHLSADDAPLFILDLSLDNAPNIDKRQTDDALYNPSTRFFDTRQAVQQLVTQLTQLAAGIAPEQLGLPHIAAKISYRFLLHRLILGWDKPPTRRFNRHPPKHHDIALGLGIRTIHALLDAPVADDVNSITSHAFFTPAPSHRSHYLAHWEIINIGAQGHALRNKTITPSHIKVGELISIREQNDEVWQLCIIKWVKNIDTETVEIGVQRLPPNARGVQVFNPLSPIKTMQPGILFPASALLNQPTLLLTPHGMYMKNVHMELITSTTHTIKPQQLVMQTQSFDLFEIPG
ncbi:MAG: hypothetical protein ABL868_00720 [Sulfuriferula sp.]